MKKKFSLWLNIVTICLCVCAIAIGVYAATSATITVSGQIGFEAHGVEGSVTAATIEGHAVKNGSDDKDGTPSEAVSLLSLKENSTTEYVPVSFNDANGISLGTKYFSDLGTEDGTTADIVIRLTITNTSKFDITAYIDDSTTTLPTNVITNNDTIPSVKITANGGTGEIVIGLQLQRVVELGEFEEVLSCEYASFDAPTIANLNIQLGFDKYIAPTYTVVKAGGINAGGATEVVEDGYIYYNTAVSQYDYLTTTMGKDANGNDVRWYAIAKQKDDGSFESLATKNYGYDTVQSGTYVFISEYILPALTDDENISCSGEINIFGYNNPNKILGDGISYNGTTVQQYINCHGNNTLAKDYNFSCSSLYANISSIDLNGEGVYTEWDEDTDTPLGDAVSTTTITENQKLFLLTLNEYKNYFGDDIAIGCAGTPDSNVGESASYWLLRTPTSTDAWICQSGSENRYDYPPMSYSVCVGIRLAFQITIE